jgi:hypothetical protein
VPTRDVPPPDDERKRQRARERKRDQRARDRALAADGMVRLRNVVVPIGLADYLRGVRFMEGWSEDDAEAIARGLERMCFTLVKDPEASQ